MEILGLIDTLESMVLDSFKIPMTGKTIVNEAEILLVIDRIRLVLQSGVDIKKSISARPESFAPKVHETGEIVKTATAEQDPQAKAIEIIQQAYQVAEDIKAGANKYADEVLANLEASANRVIRTINNGRMRLSKMTGTQLQNTSPIISDMEAPLEIKQPKK